MLDTEVYYGGAVKSLDANGKVGGYLIRFGGKDLDGEHFTPTTYLGAQQGNGADCLFHHGMPMKGTAIDADHLFAPMKTTVDEIGVWAETVLNLSDAYEAKVAELVDAGKLGWSSGAAGHTVRKTADGEITRWIIAEGSLTPTPAEPRNRALPLKTWAADEAASLADQDDPPAGTTLADDLDRALAAVSSVTARAKSANELRIKSGRVLSAASRAKVQAAHDALVELLAATELEGKSIDLTAETQKLRTDTLRLQTRLRTSLKGAIQ